MAGDEAEEIFTLVLTGSGIEIRRDVPASKIAAIMSVIMGSVPPEGGGGVPLNAGGTANPTKVSLREFLDEAKAVTKPDQIVAIGHYLATHEDKDTFSREDIKARFQTARERLPSNFPRDFNVAISKAMIAESPSRKG